MDTIKVSGGSVLISPVNHYGQELAPDIRAADRLPWFLRASSLHHS